jgi:hypothetical protein
MTDRLEPPEDVPSTVKRSTYRRGTASAERSTAALQAIADGVAPGRRRAGRANLPRRLRLDEIVDARATGSPPRSATRG